MEWVLIETNNMALLSYLSGSQLKKQIVHEGDFTDTNS